MRHFHTTAAVLGGLLLTLASGHPACAQQSPPPPAFNQPPPPAVPAAAPAPVPALPAVPPPASINDAALLIPMPTGATVQVEVDIHDDDLLGVYKSFLRGVGQAAQTMPMSPNMYARTGVTNAQMSAILSSADLSDVLKGTTHIHFIVMQVPGASLFSPPMPSKVYKGKGLASSAPATTPDQTSFYETAFGAEGGHRILYTNIEPVHMLMVSFGHTRGYAFMMQLPGTIAVMRADGYPDLSKLSAMMTQISAAAAKAALDHMPSRPKTHSDY